jgi:transposase-like protein
MKCPNCGSSARIHLYSTNTLVHIPTEYDENGVLIVPNVKNTTKEYYICTLCGRSYVETI